MEGSLFLIADTILFSHSYWMSFQADELSRSALQPPPGNRRRDRLVRPIAGLLVLGLTLLAGCGPVTPDQTSGAETPSPKSTAPSEQAVDVDSASDPGQIDSTEINTSGDSITVGPADDLANGSSDVEPDFGEITFALGVTDGNEPIDPGFLFTEGITEIHAIFEYQDMLPAYTWERVWYLNDREVSRSSGDWTESESGVFDYYIDNGGKPLPAGDWILELYVDGKLRSLGVFIIESE